MSHSIWEHADKIFKLGEMLEEADKMYSCTSTVGACHCGGLIDYTKSQWSIRKVFSIGKFIVFKKIRKLYKCQKCGEFQ